MTTFTPAYPLLSQSQASLQIEQLVKAVARSKQPAFQIVPNFSAGESARPTPLGSRLQAISSLHNVYSSQYEYSEHLQIFLQACHDLGLIQGGVCLAETWDYCLSTPWVMNHLVERIRELTQTQFFRRRAADRGFQARKNTVRTEGYVRGVLAKYSRTEVLRINLYYLEEARFQLRVEQVYADLMALIRAREHNPIFKYETGYVWSVEQGGITGSFHIHAAFFFNGAHERNYWAKGKQIEKLWKQITGGQGYAHISKRSDFKKPGVGKILRCDAQACDYVVEAVSYLTKEDQHLRVKPRGRRTVGTGQL